MDDELAVRLALLIRIHRQLRIVVPEPARADRWLHAPNAVFSGATPLAVMPGAGGLARIARYLSAEVNG